MEPINLFKYHCGHLLNQIQEEINVDHIIEAAISRQIIPQEGYGGTR